MRIQLDRPPETDPVEEQLARELARIESRENPKPRHESRQVSRQVSRHSVAIPTQVPQKYAIPTLRENEERDGYEIRFPEKPAQEVTKELSLNGWRFNPGQWKDPRWWRKRCPESLAFARHLIARLNGADMIGIRDGTGPVPLNATQLNGHIDALSEIRQSSQVLAAQTAAHRQLGEIIMKPSQRIMELLKL